MTRNVPPPPPQPSDRGDDGDGEESDQVRDDVVLASSGQQPEGDVSERGGAKGRPGTGELGIGTGSGHLDGDTQVLEIPSALPVDSAAPSGAPVLSVEADSLFTMLHGFLSQELDFTAGEGDERRRSVLLYELGHLEELVFGDSSRAQARYEQAAGTDATFIPALRGLARHYRHEGRWREVIEVLDAEIKATSGEEARAALAIQRGA
ncbi:MAG: hypothetical protein KAI47_26595, partial [Deltaproteobacteria bacterium]|nr:hypothetical protein [Deltaproteobacteria bacterium]